MTVRIIDGTAYEVKRADSFRVRAHDLGHGHLEVIATRQRVMHELDWTRDQIADHLEMLAKHEEEHAEELAKERAERSAKNAAQRAKKRVRHLVKAMDADTLLTLTYRENQTDLALCKKHLKEFNRRMERVIPGFRFVGAFERQKRGAWHVHMAVNRIPAQLQHKGAKVKSYNVIRAVWRAVAGEHGGNIDLSAKKRNSGRKTARIASYLSKYLLKAFEDGEDFKNRWTKYGDFDVPPPVEMGMVTNLHEAIEVVYGFLGELHEIATARLDRWHDWLVLHAQYQGG